VELNRLHNEQLHKVYCSLSIIRVITSRIMRWVGHVARVGDRRGVYKVSWVDLKKNRKRRPRRSWENDIETDVQEGDDGSCTGTGLV
jgi:hypothetical protein